MSGGTELPAETSYGLETLVVVRRLSPLGSSLAFLMFCNGTPPSTAIEFPRQTKGAELFAKFLFGLEELIVAGIVGTALGFGATGMSRVVSSVVEGKVIGTPRLHGSQCPSDPKSATPFPLEGFCCCRWRMDFKRRNRDDASVGAEWESESGSCRCTF